MSVDLSVTVSFALWSGECESEGAKRERGSRRRSGKLGEGLKALAMRCDAVLRAWRPSQGPMPAVEKARVNAGVRSSYPDLSFHWMPDAESFMCPGCCDDGHA